jgi:death-on-curing family protein
MEKEVIYLSAERIIELNIFAITLIKAKKADSAKVLSETKLRAVTEYYQSMPGDIYDKAVALLKGIIQKHPFASGNRRTAFLAAKIFLTQNQARLGIKDDSASARVLQGVREDYYSDDEIRRWLCDGTIREFIR